MSSFLTAGYLDISETKFLDDVEAGKYPQPFYDGRRRFWDRHQIDEAVDMQFGGVATRIVANPAIARLRET